MHVLRKFFNSRKFWAFAVGIVGLFSASFEDGVFTSEETTAIAGLFIGYIFSVAFEDGMGNRASSGTTDVTVYPQATPMTVETVEEIPALHSDESSHQPSLTEPYSDTFKRP